MKNMKTYNNPELKAELGYHLDISEYKKSKRQAHWIISVASAIGILLLIGFVSFLFAMVPLVLEYEQSLGF